MESPVLKAQIRLLGGDVDEDYQLINDVDSDSLHSDDVPANDPKLSKDVNKFIKSLDFASLKDTAIIDEDDAGPSTPSPEPEQHTQTENRVSNGKPDARVADAAAKVAESSKGSKTKFIFPPTSQWYLAVPALTSTTSLPSPSPEFLRSQSARAATLCTQDATAYTDSSSHTSSVADARFLTRVLASGTLSDRLSALTLMAQGSPVHNSRALDSLKAMAAKKGREESLKALRATVDWWVGGGAPDRKLRYFRDQPLTHPDVSEQHLVLWHFEDWLKKYFFAILQLLETLSVDPLPYVRTQAMHLIFQLLRDKPEQEQNLLRLLVNKLGDAEKAVASKASHHLLQLLQMHPQMKSIIVHEVAALILRPPTVQDGATSVGANTHARYYAVITFTQIVLVPADKAVATRLVDVYFELFRELLGEDAPETPQDQEPVDHTPKQRRGFKGQAKHKDKSKGKGKAKGPDLGFHEVPDSNSKLVSAILTGINRALPFAKPENSATFDKHISTLFRITHTATFSVSLQALTLLQHVCAQQQRNQTGSSGTGARLADRFYRALYASLADPRLAHSSKHAMYLNLLAKALKVDRDHARVAAFVRRLVQVLGMHQPPFVCGALYLLGELFGTSPDVRDTTSVARADTPPYDPRKRDPQHAHALSSCLWELLPLLEHYHPSVALHARQLLTHARVTATPDLALNTPAHFLDRFVYRNAKKPRTRGASAMQPTREDVPADVMNEASFRARKVEDVPADQVFFHKFFARKHEREAARATKAEKRKGRREESDSDAKADSESDPEEAEIWKAMKASVPELAGSDVDDDSMGVPSDDDEELADDDDALPHGSDSSDLDLLEDDDDIVSDIDAADPTGLIEYQSGSEDAEVEGEWEGFGPAPRKRAREDDDNGKKKRRKTKALPTFASYDEYATMIENAQEDDL